MNRRSNSEILACMDAIALEIASKIADYGRLQADLEALRREITPSEDHPRNLDTHELVSRAFGRRRTA